MSSNKDCLLDPDGRRYYRSTKTNRRIFYCKFDNDCPKKNLRNGYCYKHLVQILPEIAIMMRQRRNCISKGCKSISYSDKLCFQHYKSESKIKCLVDGCVKKKYGSHNYCQFHLPNFQMKIDNILN